MEPNKKAIARAWRDRDTLLVPWRGASTQAKRQRALNIALATVLDKDALIEEQVFFLNGGTNPQEVVLPKQQPTVGTLRNKQRNRTASPTPPPVNGEVLKIDSYAVFSAAAAAGASYIQGDELPIRTTPFKGLVVEGVMARAWQGCFNHRRGIILRVALADDQQRLLNTAPFYFIRD